MIVDPANGLTNGDSIDTNWSGVINANGSFVGLWRTWQCIEDNRRFPIGGDQCASVIHTATASNWKNVNSYRFGRSMTNTKWEFANQYRANRYELGIEDPFTYKDCNGIYHASFHDMFRPHDDLRTAWSRDGRNWNDGGVAFATNTMPRVTFTDGSSTGIPLERPSFILNNDGVPTHLVSGGHPSGLSYNNRRYNPNNLDSFEFCERYDGFCGAVMIVPLQQGRACRCRSAPAPAPRPPSPAPSPSPDTDDGSDSGSDGSGSGSDGSDWSDGSESGSDNGRWWRRRWRSLANNEPEVEVLV